MPAYVRKLHPFDQPGRRDVRAGTQIDKVAHSIHGELLATAGGELDIVQLERILPKKLLGLGLGVA